MGACEYLDRQPAVPGCFVHPLPEKNNYQKDQEIRRVYGFIYLFIFIFTNGTQHLLWENKHTVGFIHILLFLEKR